MSTLGVSTDPSKMEAFAWRSVESHMHMMKLSSKEVIAELNDKGIVFGIEQEVVKMLAGPHTNEKESPPRLTVAYGQEPEEGTSPEVKTHFEPNQLLEQGKVVASLVGGSPPIPGRKVDGTEIPARPAPPSPLEAGENVKYDKEDRTFHSLVPGYARLKDEHIHIRPLVTISEDEMSATIELCTPSDKKLFPFKETLLELIEKVGVVYGIQEKELDRALETLLSGQALPKPFEAAKGLATVHDKDASIQFVFDTDRQAGSLGEDGKIDYRRQQRFPQVYPKDLLATKIPIAVGTPGKTVTGRVLPNRPGKDLNLQLFENVEVSPDGLSFLAAIDGFPLRNDYQLRVMDLLVVEGNIDFRSGDIDCPKGILVKGTIRSTFAVRAKGAVAVEDSIEDAIIEAADDIDVKRGILQGTVGSVTTSGSVRALYANIAQISTGESIELRSSSVNSFLKAEHRVTILEQRGRLVGGHVVAGESVEVLEAGSGSNVDTIIQIGADFKELDEIELKVCEIEKRRAKILLVGGRNLLKYVKKKEERTPKDSEVQELVEEWCQLTKEKKKLRNNKKEILKHARKTKGFIVVHEVLHPNVLLIIGQTSLHIKHRTPGGRFHLNATGSKIRHEAI